MTRRKTPAPEPTLDELTARYGAALDDMETELQQRQAEIQGLRRKLRRKAFGQLCDSQTLSGIPAIYASVSAQTAVSLAFWDMRRAWKRETGQE